MTLLLGEDPLGPSILFCTEQGVYSVAIFGNPSLHPNIFSGYRVRLRFL
jgi:hypothetical protein